MPYESIAVACVLESSVTVLSEWPSVFEEYIMPMLKRLSEMYAGYAFKLGVVSYATAESRPSPVLEKRFFMSAQPVTKLLRDEPENFGLGQSNGGGSSGMSALDGFMAAIEMFDCLSSVESRNIVSNEPQPKDNPKLQNIYHIFHVASFPADGAEHPSFNQNEELDNVTWETLPEELRKRSISLSTINLRQLVGFSELYSSVAAGTGHAPWFNVRSLHSVLLAGFPTSKSMKRSIENPYVERSPDAKRPKLRQSSNEPSPRIKGALPKPPQSQSQSQPVPTSIPQSENVPQSQTPFQSATQREPQTVAQPAPPGAPQTISGLQIRENVHNAMNQLKRADAELKRLDASIAVATSQGNIQAVEELQRQRIEHLARREQARKVIAVLMSTMRQNHGQSADAMTQSVMMAQGQIQNSGAPSAGSQTQQSQMPAQMSPRMDVQPPGYGTGDSTASSANLSGPGADPNAVAQLLNRASSIAQQRVVSNINSNATATQGINAIIPQGIPLPMQPNVSPQMAAQMQKLIEHQRNRGPTSMLGKLQPDSTSTRLQTSSSGPGGSELGRPPLASGSNVVWQGMLSWTGFDAATQGKKEVHTEVAANVQNGGDSKSETWPNVMSLTPAREPAVPTPDLQLWIRTHKPVLCTFHPHARTTDPKVNESHYRSLLQLLTGKNIYAMAAWTLPSGLQINNVLVFPFNNTALVGAFFPVSGIPELPKPSGIRAGLNIPPQMVAQLQNLTQEQKYEFLLRMSRQRSQNPQQTQVPQQHAVQPSLTQDSPSLRPDAFSGFNPNPFSNSPNGLLGLLGSNPSQGVSQGSMHANVNMPGAAGIQRPVSGGAGMGNVSYEMMQSFMQRSADGAGGGMGLGDR